MASSHNLSAEIIEKLRAKGVDIDALLRDPTPEPSMSKADFVEVSDADSGESIRRSTASRKRKAPSSSSTRRSTRLNKGKRKMEEKAPTPKGEKVAAPVEEVLEPIPEVNLVDEADRDPAEETEREADVVPPEGDVLEKEREIIKPLVVDRTFFESHSLGSLLELFEVQGWGELLGGELKVNVAMVKEFYDSFSIRDVDGVIFGSFSIDGEMHAFTSQNLAKWLGVKHMGFGDYHKGKWPSGLPEDMNVRRVVSLVAEDRNVPVANASNRTMGILHRSAHKLVCTNFLPRLQKHSIVLIQDFLILYHLISKRPINLARQIMHHMEHVRMMGKHGLPYPGVVKTILEKSGVYKAENEEECFDTFGAINLEKMGWEYVADGWVRRQKTAKKPATPKKSEIPPASEDQETPVPPAIPPQVDIASLVSEIRRLSEAVDGMRHTLTTVEDSMSVLMVSRSIQSEQMTELSRQLRHVGTKLLDELTPILRSFR